MDKQTIIKIAIAAVVAILAIVYYFSSHKEPTNYNNFLSNEIVVENKTEEKSKEENSNIKVYVTGEVNTPGVIELEEGSRIQDAIEGAGGIKPEANLQDVNLAYEISDGEKIYIPNFSETNIETSNNESTTSEQTSSGNPSSTTTSNGKININKATVTELTNIPGIGASTAQKIITYRDENGKFKTIEDIKNVSGIGDSKYEKMKDFICVK